MEEEKKEPVKNRNPYTRALNVIGFTTLFVGIIGSFYLGDLFSIGWDFNYGVFLAGAFASTCTCVLMLGLGEIINILDDNRNFLRKIAGDTSDIGDTSDQREDEFEEYESEEEAGETEEG